MKKPKRNWITERHKTELLNILFNGRERVSRYSNLHKKAVVIEFTRYGCSPQEIHAASGLALDFVYNTVRAFSHGCLAEAVAEIGKEYGEEEQQDEVSA